MPKRLPTIPDGLTVHEKLLFVKTPMTAAMLAELLGISVESVYKAARSHRLPTLPRLSGLRFDGVEVARWLFDSPTQKTRHKKSQ
jgi:Helix-turn-helix domain